MSNEKGERLGASIFRDCSGAGRAGTESVGLEHDSSAEADARGRRFYICAAPPPRQGPLREQFAIPRCRSPEQKDQTR
jgi:hypothetical protein